MGNGSAGCGCWSASVCAGSGAKETGVHCPNPSPQSFYLSHLEKSTPFLLPKPGELFEKITNAVRPEPRTPASVTPREL